MLKLEDIVYPIIFKATSQPFITFSKEGKPGVWSCGQESGLDIEYFIKAHNRFNPENDGNEVNSYVMGGRAEHLYQCSDSAIRNAKANSQLVNSTFSAVATVTGGMCRIEDMPIVAKLTAINIGDGAWLECVITPKRIEIHDDVICLLLHYGSGNGSVAGEINIKRGALVRWSK